MGWLTDLDGAIQQRLQDLEIDGRRALRTVGPLTGKGRQAPPPEVLGAVKPALLYVIEQAGAAADGVLASVEAVLLAEGLRGGGAAWRGDTDTIGTYALAEAVARALQAPDLAGTAGAWLKRQRMVHADGRIVALAQEYEVLAGGESVLIDAQELIGGPSIVRITQQADRAHWQSEGYAGSAQRYARWQGRGPQQIVFEGTLWAADEAGLRNVEQAIANLLEDRALHVLATGAGQTWPDAALTAWERRGGRIQQSMLGLVGQATRVAFEQYPQ